MQVSLGVQKTITTGSEALEVLLMETNQVLSPVN
jgi:hypothetical protein